LNKDDPRITGLTIHMRLWLMLMLGQAREVRSVLPAQETWLENRKDVFHALDFRQFRESLLAIQLWAAAAVGDYKTMDAALAELESYVPPLDEPARHVRSLLVHQLTLDPILSRAIWCQAAMVQPQLFFVMQRRG